MGLLRHVPAALTTNDERLMLLNVPCEQPLNTRV